MLLQFTFSNYRAFQSPQTLSLGASNYDKSLSSNLIETEVAGHGSRRWLKGAGIYGPNASGKSSVIDALRALSRFVTQSAKTIDPEDEIRFIEPFGFSEVPEPTAFSISFVNDEKRYEFRVAATREKVWHESLRTFKSSKEQLLYSRTWDNETGAYLWSSDESEGYRRDLNKEEYTLRNVLYLSKAISLGDKQLDPVFRWFKNRLKFIDLSTKGRELHNGFTARQFQNSTSLAPKILKLLKQADLGIEDVHVTSEEMPEMANKIYERIKDMIPLDVQEQIAKRDKNAESLRVQLSHQMGERSASLPWRQESAGTHRLFALAGPWLDILENGHTVCIDELETSMHPLMVSALLKLLFCKENNPKGAQVIFTTHNPLLLDSTLLRRDQVWFADKDDQGVSHLYPLTNYSPRKGESLVRGYLTGRYGAMPFIPKGLLSSFSKESPEKKEDYNE